MRIRCNPRRGLRGRQPRRIGSRWRGRSRAARSTERQRQLPEEWESGFKATVITYPGQVPAAAARYGTAASSRCPHARRGGSATRTESHSIDRAVGLPPFVPPRNLAAGARVTLLFVTDGAPPKHTPCRIGRTQPEMPPRYRACARSACSAPFSTFR